MPIAGASPVPVTARESEPAFDALLPMVTVADRMPGAWGAKMMLNFTLPPIGIVVTEG
jgi:hypothetical protein